MLKNLADKIVALLTDKCAGGLARFGTVGYTHKALLGRLRHLGRLPDASTVSPGYVPHHSCVHDLFAV